MAGGGEEEMERSGRRCGCEAGWRRFGWVFVGVVIEGGDGEVDEVMAGRGLMVVVYRHLAWIANDSVDWRVKWDS